MSLWTEGPWLFTRRFHRYHLRVDSGWHPGISGSRTVLKGFFLSWSDPSLSHSHTYPLTSPFTSSPLSKFFYILFSFLSQICLPGSHSLAMCLISQQSQLLQPPPEGPKANSPSTPLTFCYSIITVNAACKNSTFTPYPVSLGNLPPKMHVLAKNGPDGMFVTDTREILSLSLPPEFSFQSKKHDPWHLGEKGRKCCKN